MVNQLSSRPGVHAGAPAAMGACRGPGLLLRRSLTAVRCFKSNSSDDAGARSSTVSSLKLNFKVGYRVNFGQTIAMIGSGDALGNWDPKRSIAMKWTDGDYWTVELNVAPGSALDLEYKYVVVNSDGHIGYWKPGSNYKVTLPLNSSGSKVPKRVKVADAWDDSYKKVDVEEAEALPASPSSKGTSAAAAAPPPPPKAAPPPPAAAAASSSAPASGAAQPKAAAQAPPAAAPPPPPPQQGKQQQQQPAAAAQQAAPSNGAGPSQKPQNGIPRATSPRSGSAPAGFAAITSIPAIHPTLMAEQERLEDGVKMSLEDLQNQMDKHQQLRERTDEAKLAAAEARASVLAEAVAALTKEVASLKDQLSDMRALLTSTSELLVSVLRQPLPGSGSGGATQQVFVGAPGFAAFAMQQPQQQHTTGGGMASWWGPQQLPQAGQGQYSQYSPAALQHSEQPAAASWAPAAAAPTVIPVGTEQPAVDVAPVPAAQSVGGAGLVLPQLPAVAARRVDARRTSLVRTMVRRHAAGHPRVAVLGRGLAARKAAAKAAAPDPAPAAHPESPTDVTPQAPSAPSSQPVMVLTPAAASPHPSSNSRDTGRQQADSSAPIAPAAPANRARAASAAALSAPPVRAPMASAAKAAAVAAVLLPVVCGVGRGAKRGARGRFNMQQYRDAVRARAKDAPACIELSAVKNEGVWADVNQPQQLTPTEFMQEAGLKGKNWKASIRVVANGEVGAALSEVLAQVADHPAAVEVLVADRIVAAANNRVVAYNKALKAVQEYNRLPPSAGPASQEKAQ
ncbi:hypothetical protein CHLRE_02g091750v5 [Chlamydomonas reinhardtii]|uniref:CBM20 domain-containing protein n=1 Tax=Chlamydomonas reinhardtii TaxID=3055 RepID=A0A2K3E1A6_CHLRE|nr:uncharacterized protein CHLRE_02g091750v5 [Chlamydomonas reinhardtii]PNW86564.1 hypothetical protein CHLRE_02g091750v5 [Chlamydomonas reinhardtii]